MAKINGMPTSIRAGIPKLSDTPIGWKREKLNKHLFEIKRPINLEPEKTYGLVTVKRSRGGVEIRSCLSGSEIKTPSQFLIEAGDFLISKRQIVHGACGIVPDDLAGSVVSNEYAVIGTKGGIDLTFLQYLSESMYFQQACFHSSIGVHVEKMIFDVNRWLNWHFNIPPLAEQKKIVEILDVWDKAIKAQENLIKNSCAQKKALAQKLLNGRIRFKGSKKNSWVQRPLGNICSLKGGSAFKEEYQGIRSGKYPFIKVSDMNLNGNKKYIKFANNYISEEIRLKLRPNVFPEKSIVFAKVGAALLLNRRRILVSETIIDNNMMAAIPGSGIDTEFFYQLLSEIDFGRYVQEGAVPSINQAEISSIKVNLPPLEEQLKIASCLRVSDEEIECLNIFKDQLLLLKQALLQQLLSGKIRVKTDESLTKKFQPKVKK